VQLISNIAVQFNIQHLTLDCL